MVTDQQVALLRQRQMEGKKQQTAAAMAWDERAVGVSEVADGGTVALRRPRPSAGGKHCAPTPFDGVWEEEILPLRQGRGRRQAQGNDICIAVAWEREIPRPVAAASPAPHPATPVTGLAGTQRSGSGGLLPPTSIHLAGRRSSTSPTATLWE